MFDTINFKITQVEAGGVDFLEELPCYLDNVGEHLYNGVTFISGDLKGLKVTANSFQVRVKDGSLCKFALGDNLKTMGRKDTQRAIELLSDTLHLPMGKAVVTRLDIAQNFIVKHPVSVYLNQLGLLKNAVRLMEPDGLYYSQKEGRLCFYDKVKEQRNHREPVPELYKGRNVLRYEQRYTGKIASRLGVAEVTGSLLYDEHFYIKLLNRWKDTYQAIQKINDLTFNFAAMTTKQEFYKMGLMALIERAGGQLEMIALINDAQKRGDLTKKQAFDFRNLVKEVCKTKEGFAVPNEAIKELDKKVMEAIRFYR
jgi:hypothetical protein